MKKTRRLQAHGSQAGLTFVEASLAVALTGLISGASVLLMTSASSAASQERTRDELAAEARRAINQIGDVLSRGSADSVGAQPEGVFFQQLQAQQIDSVGGVPTPGDVHLIQFQYSPVDPNDGVDNDGNGVVDDGIIVWVRNPGPGQLSQVICRNVRETALGEVSGNGLDDNGDGLADEPGLSIDFPPDFPASRSFFRVQLTLEQVDRQGRVVTTSAQRVIAFNNN